MKSKDKGIKSISLENFRVFKDKCDFELAPITILTGANSSGKSSLIKSLKLLQTFWEKNNKKYILHFEKGTHLLGDFEMVINKDSQKNKIIITYKIEKQYYSYLFGTLYVENVFELDKNSPLKNGKLKKSSIYTQDKDQLILLYSTKRFDCKRKIDTERIIKNGIKYFFNREYIIENYLSKFQTILKECLEFQDIVKSYISKDYIKIEEETKIGTIKDYTGIIKKYSSNFTIDFLDNKPVVDAFYAPVINEQFCNFMKFDYEKCKVFEYTDGIFKNYGGNEPNFRVEYENMKDEPPMEYHLGLSDLLKDVDEKHYVNHPKILDLIAKIPIAEYNEPEKILWKLLLKDYPDVSKKFDYDSFVEIINDPNNKYLFYKNFFLNELKKYLEKNPLTDFNSIYDVLMHETVRHDRYYIRFFENEMKEWNLSIGFCSIPQLISPPKYTFEDEERLSSFNFNLIGFFLYLTQIEEKLFEKSAKDISLNWAEKIKEWYDTPLNTFINRMGEMLNDLCYKSINAFSNMYFIDSIRANSQRIYTQISQGTSFNEFLMDFIQQEYQKNEKDFLNHWTKQFEIGELLLFDEKEAIERGVGLKLSFNRGSSKINIADLGYGVTQFLPILMHIIYAASKNRNRLWSPNYPDVFNEKYHRKYNELTVVIEEPETNLHPKFQSKLAELFIDATKKFGMKFIIETHSEYLVRKLQVLTAEGNIEPEDTVINYIDYPEAARREPKTEQVRIIHISKDGELSQPFGSGFIDEADNLAMKLWSHF